MDVKKKDLVLKIQKRSSDPQNLLLLDQQETPKLMDVNSALEPQRLSQSKTFFFQDQQQTQQLEENLKQFQRNQFLIEKQKSQDMNEVYQEYLKNEQMNQHKKKIINLKELFEKVFLNQAIQLESYKFSNQTLKLIELIVNKKFFKTASRNSN